MLRRRLDTHGHTSTWQATDGSLDRHVHVRVVLPEHPHAEAVLDAARRAVSVEDPRLSRILDIGDDHGIRYVISEWLPGPSLETQLRAGPLLAEAARTVVGEVALALEAARHRGLHHLRLVPSCVHLLDDGTVKLTDLATAAALTGVDADDHDGSDRASRQDTHDLIGLAYAALTATWPLPSGSGLPAAPQVAGHPVAPSQIVTGAPADLDTLCAQTFAGAGAPDTPGDLAGQIAPWGRQRQQERSDGTFPHALPPTVRPRPSPAQPSPAQPSPAQPSGAPTVPARQTAPGKKATPQATAKKTTAKRAGAKKTSSPGMTPQPPGAAAGAAGATTTATPEATAVLPPGGATPVLPATTEPATQPATQPATEPDARPLSGPGRPDVVPSAPPPDPATLSARRPADLALADFFTQEVAGFAATPPSGPHDVLSAPDDAGQPRSQTRTVLILVGAFVVVFLLLAYCGLRGLGDNAFVPTPATSTPATGAPTSPTSIPSASTAPITPTPTLPTGQPVAVVSARGFDPQGDESEKDSQADQAIDGRPTTSWTSDRYRSAEFGGLKKGVGLLLDLGDRQQVSQVVLQLPADGVTVELRTADDDELTRQVLAKAADATGTVTLRLTTPIETDNLVVWFTQLGPVSGGYRAEVAEVAVS